MTARLFACLGLLLFAASAFSADPSFEKVDPKGKPSGFRPGLSSRYVIWYDAGIWHIRVTTGSASADFQGTIKAIDGKIISMKLISSTTGGKRGANLPPLKTQSTSIHLSNKIVKGSQNGYDFKLDDKATAIEFDLKIDGKEAPEKIFVGAKGAHPKGSVVCFPPSPARRNSRLNGSSLFAAMLMFECCRRRAAAQKTHS